MEKLYFAYGSNTHLTQMAGKCPGAKAIKVAALEGYELAFMGEHPKDGFANIVPKAGASVPGVLWKINSMHENALDYYEGFPRSYRKDVITVTDCEGQSHQAMVYVMNEERNLSLAVPSFNYFWIVQAGYQQNDLPLEPLMEALERARRAAWQDKTPERKADEYER